MPSSCAVLNCNDRYGHAENISFHKFPFKRQELLQKWLDFTQRDATWKPSRWSAICSRHFREVDFNCVNERKTLKKIAVPSVRPAEQLRTTDQRSQQVVANVEEDLMRDGKSIEANQLKAVDTQSTVEDIEREEAQTQSQLHGSPSVPKINCRLCGHASANVVTFSTNFEIYGMIQKCFPTLNIQKDDNLPKEMCRACLKRLESFSRFIDKVLETQSELQHKYRTEKTSNSNRTVERQLKVKQEPVVRVKQEVSEGFESFLSDDLDMAMDEGCEQEQDSSTVEQKYDFCDFPMLNAQDIINNCDIMEIINLDDPFINIPDDDANTNCDTQQQQLPPKRTLQSAHELLQAHLLIEEHSYAYAPEDMKEEWQLKSFYKTEKIEGAESSDMAEDLAHGEHADDDATYGTGEQTVNEATANSSLTASLKHTTEEKQMENRSTKPIVTSVSELAETRLALPTVAHGSPSTDKPLVTAVNALPSTNTTSAPVKTHTKPNIVVLNESIVKSSSAFQLYTCSTCHLKFFSVESLNQHYANLHQQLPMVSLPSEYAWKPMCGLGETLEKNCKVEKGNDFNCYEVEMNIRPDNRNLDATNLYKSNEAIGQSQPLCPELHKTLECADAVKKKNQVKILEMQQTFLRQHEHFTMHKSDTINFNKTRGTEETREDSTLPSSIEKNYVECTKANNAVEQRNLLEQKLRSMEALLKSTATLEPRSARQIAEKLKAAPNNDPVRADTHKSFLVTAEQIAESFMRLQRRYRQLQRKCRSLRAHIHVQRQPQQRQLAATTFHCRICRLRFDHIYRVLRHKQSCRHWIPQPKPHFAATCCGCEKFFRSRVALRNHMRYICQSLPLRWLKTQMQTFKCRCCRRSTFNHWRLYRRHEVKCKRIHSQRQQQQMWKHACTLRRQLQRVTNSTKVQKIKKSSKAASTSRRTHNTPTREYICALCKKVYPSANSLNQHSITHTDQRRHNCKLCARVFKRRNGLTQHVKSFHLNLKPYKCPVCQHCYALKHDMLRCRHSVKRNCPKSAPVGIIV